MTEQTKRFCDFGPFRVDRQKRLLLQGSENLAPPPKALDVLLFLIDDRGRVIEKAEFMQAVWPDSFVEEGNLSQNIFLLRKTLGEGQDGQRYILTVPGVGYRFVPEVIERDEPTPAGPRVVAEPSRLDQSSAHPPRRSAGLRSRCIQRHSRWHCQADFTLFYWQHKAAPQALQETQLTTNASEASLTAAAISSDGKYLAFADEHGLYVRETGSGGDPSAALRGCCENLPPLVVPGWKQSSRRRRHSRIFGSQCLVHLAARRRSPQTAGGRGGSGGFHGRLKDSLHDETRVGNMGDGFEWRGTREDSERCRSGRLCWSRVVSR